MMPSISVVIACRNEVATLGACLDALDAQSFRRFETIVVDGGSDDGSREMAKARGVRLLDDGANGPSGARNLGIRAARAPIVAFTDADCVPERDWLLRMSEIFAQQPALAGVGGALRMSRASAIGRLEDIEARARYRGFITSNVAYRRPALLALGGFDETLRCAEDCDLAWRAMDAGFLVIHDRRPVVMHAPPENSGALLPYLRKQFWYARADVPTHARTRARGSRRGTAGEKAALRNCAWACAAALGVATLQPLVAGGALAGLAMRSASDVNEAAKLCGDSPDSFVHASAVVMARRLARGAGTLVGYADLARRDVRARVSSPAPVGFARAGQAPLAPGSPA